MKVLQMSIGERWQCSYCGDWQVLHDSNFKSEDFFQMAESSDKGAIGMKVISIACLNHTCKKLTLAVFLCDKIRIKKYHEHIDSYVPALSEIPLLSWDLLPESLAKPQPDYIPEQIKKDYEEACKIAQLSPNAAATLARRCVEGMIKDFCKISENNLYKTIEKLKKDFESSEVVQGITEESIKALDEIRELGNIGAHLNDNTNLIGRGIEYDDVQALTVIIEILFKDWYIASHNRKQKFSDLRKRVTEKTKQPESDAANRGS